MNHARSYLPGPGLERAISAATFGSVLVKKCVAPAGSVAELIALHYR